MVELDSNILGCGPELLEEINTERTHGKEYVEVGDVKGVDAERVDVEGVDVEGVDMEGINFEGADVKGADVEGADVEAVDDKCTVVEGREIGDLRRTRLARTLFVKR